MNIDDDIKIDEQDYKNWRASRHKENEFERRFKQEGGDPNNNQRRDVDILRFISALRKWLVVAWLCFMVIDMLLAGAVHDSFPLFSPQHSALHPFAIIGLIFSVLATIPLSLGTLIVIAVYEIGARKFARQYGHHWDDESPKGRRREPKL